MSAGPEPFRPRPNVRMSRAAARHGAAQVDGGPRSVGAPPPRGPGRRLAMVRSRWSGARGGPARPRHAFRRADALLRFRVLGDVLVVVDDMRVAFELGQQLGVLAALLVEVNTAVPLEVLAERVW